jgi:hypothetical protein
MGHNLSVMISYTSSNVYIEKPKCICQEHDFLFQSIESATPDLNVMEWSEYH